MKKEIPPILTNIILPFHWDVKQVWNLEAEIKSLDRKDFDYLLFLPLWSNNPKLPYLFNLTPINVLNNNFLYLEHYKRIVNSDISYPLDFIFYKNNLWILDGIHRLSKLYKIKSQSINIRVHNETIINKIKLDTTKHRREMN